MDAGLGKLLSFTWYYPDFPGGRPPSAEVRNEETGYQNDKNRHVISNLVINKASKPCSRGPSHTDKEHKGSKNTSIGLSFEKIRCDEGRESCRDSVFHTEEESIEVG